jgi:hypothetical protein
MSQDLISLSFDGFSFDNTVLTDFRYFADSLHMTLSCNSVSDTIKLSFEWIHSFRLTDEGDLLKMLFEQNGKMITGFYRVENSSYLEWFNAQSAGVHTDKNIIHYLIVTVNDVVDVLSSQKPLVTFSQ